ncbi:hypothetical protein ACCS78_30185, partial [Rhizobium johnstonii]
HRSRERKFQKILDAVNSVAQMPPDAETLGLSTELENLKIRLEQLQQSGSEDPALVDELKRRIADLQNQILIKQKMIVQFGDAAAGQRRFFRTREIALLFSHTTIRIRPSSGTRSRLSCRRRCFSQLSCDHSRL